MKLANSIFSMVLAVVVTFVAIACNGTSDQNCACDVNAVVYIEDMPCACNGGNCACADRAVAKCSHLPTAEVHVDDSICTDPHCTILPENIFYGVLEILGGPYIKIFKGAGVTDDQIAAALPNIQAGYDGMDTSVKADFRPNAPSRIVLLASIDDNTSTFVNGVLSTRHNRSTGSFQGLFTQIANGSLENTIIGMLPMLNNVRLAVTPKTFNYWKS